jgi:hypothetical protein
MFGGLIGWTDFQPPPCIIMPKQPKKPRHYATPTPAPPRRKSQESENETPPQEQWLDSIDPQGTRYTAPDKVVAWVRWITPDDAKEWLPHVPDYQRTPKSRSLKDFTADMREGYWIKGVPTIVFDRNGDLIDGQHVLSALIASDLDKILCLVVINRWPDAYLGYDLGIKRSLADNLKGETVAPAPVGRVLNVLQQWFKSVYEGTGYMKAREGSIRLAGRRGRELLAANPGIEAHLFPNPFRTNRGYRSVAAMHAASYRLHQIDPEMAKKFFHCFTTEEDMTAGHPVLALRKRFRDMKENERLRSGPTLALILNAWELFVTHQKVARLPFRMGQPFPEIAIPLPVPASSKQSRIQ